MGMIKCILEPVAISHLVLMCFVT